MKNIIKYVLITQRREGKSENENEKNKKIVKKNCPGYRPFNFIS